jgi:PleD family two-component response regulator
MRRQLTLALRVSHAYSRCRSALARLRTRRVSPTNPVNEVGHVQQRVAVIGDPSQRPPLEDVLGAGNYDVEFVDSTMGAYSEIVRSLPDRIIVCVETDDLQGFQLLSMLKLDSRTRGIPMVTYVGYPAQEGPAAFRDDNDAFVRDSSAMRMH